MWMEEQYFGTQEMVDRTVSEIFKKAMIFNNRTEGIEILSNRLTLAADVSRPDSNGGRSLSHDRHRRSSEIEIRRQKTINKRA